MSATIGDRMRNLRERINKSQREMADYLNCAPSTYSMYEQNKREPNIETLIKIVDVFNVSLDYLLRGREFEQKEISEVLKMELQDQIKDIELEISALNEKLNSIKKFLRE